MKLLILAQNPKTDKNKEAPLVGTKSWTILSRWLKEAGIPEDAVELSNTLLQVGSLTSIKTQVIENTSRLNGMIIRYPVIVTLGEIARSAIQRTRKVYYPNVDKWDHFFLPHPSGLNRKLNSKQAHEEAIGRLQAAYLRMKQLEIYERRSGA